MPAPFAALEARTANAVIARLANAIAIATPSGGGASASVPVIFDAEYVDVLGTQAVGPVLQGIDADLAAYRAHGATFAIRGVTYKGVETMPDGAGMTMIRLQRAS